MFKSTIKNSNIIINPLKKGNNDKNNRKIRTFLREDNNKNFNMQKNNSNKQLLNTKSEIGFYSKYNNEFNNIFKNNNSKEPHSIKKEIFLQKLKDMIFSPGDINYNGKENQIQNNYNYEKKIIKSSNRTKSSDKIFDSRKNENGATNNYKSAYSNKNNEISNPTNNQINLLPPKLDNRKTLVLDLDETLIHSAFEPFNPKDDIRLNIKIKGEEYIIHVLKRPFLDQFLKIVSEKYEIIIFTASISDYANPLLDKLDPFKKISHRLFRDHCTRTDNGLFIKDLNKLGRNLKDVIIIDNNPISYTLNKMNGLPILTWHSIQSDNELIKLIPLLLYLTNIDDVRIFINKVVNGYYINYKEVDKIIRNNFSNNKDEDDYFKNWFISNSKNNNSKNYKNDDENKNKAKEDKNKNKDLDNQKNKSFKNIIKYKGLLGGEDIINFDNYKKIHHLKIVSGFLESSNNSNSNKDKENDFKKNSDINKKSLFINNLNDNNILKRDKLLENKRNNSSKNLKSNNFLNIINKDNTPIKNNNKERISNINFNFDYFNNSKLNITDSNINANNKIIMNNNTHIINNNFYLINNQPSMINSNNSTIEHSSRNILNNNKPIYKYGYQSANYFFHKKERTENEGYKQNKDNKNVLSNLIDNLIQYNSNKKKNIDSHQLVAISNNSNLFNFENIKNKQQMNNLILNNIKTGRGRELYEKFNSKTKENFDMEKNNKNIINSFLNNKINIIDNYKENKDNLYINTENNLKNNIQMHKKNSFLYRDNSYKKNFDLSNLTNFRIKNNYSNTRDKKNIKYLSPTSNFKLEL